MAATRAGKEFLYYGKAFNSMARRLYEITLTMPEGAIWVNDPLLAHSYPLRVTREGVGYNRIVLFSEEKEFTFKRSGLFAWKIIFQTPAGPGGEKVHVIYTI